MGAMAERPEMAARALIFVGLAEGIAIYGLIIAIMILGKI
jgi:V/A-type H+-transporting ATPase subunit K